MVVASPNLNTNENIQHIDLPIIDLSLPRSLVSKLIVKACEDYGFFNVVNHGVSFEAITRMEQESLAFFTKTASEKQRTGTASPFGYGSKNIGSNGDMGELEYLLFNTDEASIAQTSKTISDDNPTTFSSTVCDYIEAVRELACDLLVIIAEGLKLLDTSVFSSLVNDVNSDSVFRLNYYPATSWSPTSKVGFGEHTDPQILTILRSNGIEGLQISPENGVWVPVPSDHAAFCVNVGDALQAMTNGRFTSVRHRVFTNAFKSRMSMSLFSGPPLNTIIKALPEMVTLEKPLIYRPYTWAEYKKKTYSLRLGETRLNVFRIS